MQRVDIARAERHQRNALRRSPGSPTRLRGRCVCAFVSAVYCAQHATFGIVISPPPASELDHERNFAPHGTSVSVNAPSTPVVAVTSGEPDTSELQPSPRDARRETRSRRSSAAGRSARRRARRSRIGRAPRRDVRVTGRGDDAGHRRLRHARARVLPRGTTRCTACRAHVRHAARAADDLAGRAAAANP